MLVVGDTCGFHARGATVRPGVRIEIYAANRRNPFLPFVGLDPWSLPLLRRRKIPLFWSLLALGERVGVIRSQWRNGGRVRAGDPVLPVS